MNAQEALSKLGRSFLGLGLHQSSLKSKRKNAQYKFTWRPERHQWLTMVVWTTITNDGPLPDKQAPIQILLFGNKLAKRCIWMFSRTKRFRRDKEVFSKRLRKRAELAQALAESVVYCPSHPGPVTLKVIDGKLAWRCTKLDCPFRGYVPEALSDTVRRHTSSGFWHSHCE